MNWVLVTAREDAEVAVSVRTTRDVAKILAAHVEGGPLTWDDGHHRSVARSSHYEKQSYVVREATS